MAKAVQSHHAAPGAFAQNAKARQAPGFNNMSNIPSTPHPQSPASSGNRFTTTNQWSLSEDEISPNYHQSVRWLLHYTQISLGKHDSWYVLTFPSSSAQYNEATRWYGSWICFSQWIVIVLPNLQGILRSLRISFSDKEKNAVEKGWCPAFAEKVANCVITCIEALSGVLDVRLWFRFVSILALFPLCTHSFGVFFATLLSIASRFYFTWRSTDYLSEICTYPWWCHGLYGTCHRCLWPGDSLCHSTTRTWGEMWICIRQGDKVVLKVLHIFIQHVLHYHTHMNAYIRARA